MALGTTRWPRTIGAWLSGPTCSSTARHVSAGAVWHCCSVWEVLCSLAPPAPRAPAQALLHLGSGRGATLLQPPATDCAAAAPASKEC